MAVVSAEGIVLWNQVGQLQTELFSLRSELQSYKQREAEAKRIDTSPKKNEWLPNNKDQAEMGLLKPPKKYSSGFPKFLWEKSYSPRKDKTYDVAYVEWRMSGQSREQGESELVEVLWVAAVVNSSRTTGYDMTIDLQFLDEKGFRLAETQGKGHIFPMDSNDDLPNETKLRGSIWVPLKLARVIQSVTGVWSASPGF